MGLSRLHTASCFLLASVLTLEVGIISATARLGEARGELTSSDGRYGEATGESTQCTNAASAATQRFFNVRAESTEARIGIFKNACLGTPMRSKGFEHREQRVLWCILTQRSYYSL